MKLTVLSVAMLAAASGSAMAQVVNEVENNNSVALAQFVGAINAPGGSILVDGTVGLQDTDWYAFSVSGPATIVVSAFSLGVPALVNLTLADSLGNTIVTSSAPFAVALPAQLNLPAGTYHAVVSGTAGAAAPVPFDYKLIIGANVAVPTPGSAALLGLGGMLVARRKR